GDRAVPADWDQAGRAGADAGDARGTAGARWGWDMDGAARVGDQHRSRCVDAVAGGEEPAVAGGTTASAGDAGVAQWRSAALVVAAAAVAAAVHRGRGGDPLRGAAVGLRARRVRGRATQDDREGADGTRARASG